MAPRRALEDGVLPQLGGQLWRDAGFEERAVGTVLGPGDLTRGMRPRYQVAPAVRHVDPDHVIAARQRLLDRGPQPGQALAGLGRDQHRTALAQLERLELHRIRVVDLVDHHQLADVPGPDLRQHRTYRGELRLRVGIRA